MPNADRKMGLVPIEYLDASPYTGKARMYFIPASDLNAYSIGDPVTIGGGADARGVASVVLATAGSTNTVLGAIVGAPGTIYGAAQIDPATTGNSTLVPATKTKGYYVLVSDDPNIVYMVQEGGAGAALAAADVGLNINLLAAANSGFRSQWTIDNGSEAVGATLQMKLLGLVQMPDNEFGAFAKWKVCINIHPFKAGVAGV
jgi:hypothetical protein